MLALPREGRGLMKWGRAVSGPSHLSPHVAPTGPAATSHNVNFCQ